MSLVEGSEKRRGAESLASLGLLLLLGAIVLGYTAFIFAPEVAQAGAVQRIFYGKLGAVGSSYLMLVILLLSSALWLATRRHYWDAAAEASAEVAFLFSSIVLCLGIVWARHSWNTWWHWEPRLASFLVLWLMLISYCVLRALAENHPRGSCFAAVLGILIPLTVPLVIFSVHLFESSLQLHPQVIWRGGLADPSFTAALVMALAACALVSFCLFRVTLAGVLEKQKLCELGARLDLLAEGR